MTTSKEFRKRARESIKENIVAVLLLIVVLCLFSFFVPENAHLIVLLAYFICSTIVGVYSYILCLFIAEGKKVVISDINKYSSKNIKLLGLTFYIGFITFLYSLLFIIPGIIKAYSYSMSYFVFKDTPDLSIRQITAQSKKIMDGNKARLYRLDMSFALLIVPLAVFNGILMANVNLVMSQSGTAMEFEQGATLAIIYIALEYLLNIIFIIFYTFIGLYIQICHAHFYLELTVAKAEPLDNEQTGAGAYNAVMPMEWKRPSDPFEADEKDEY